jgi:hypothetical protein
MAALALLAQEALSTFATPGAFATPMLLVQKFRQIENNHDVEADHARVEHVCVVGEVLKFQGQVDSRRNHSEPLGPMLALADRFDPGRGLLAPGGPACPLFWGDKMPD